FLGIVVCNTAFILCISTATSALPVYLIEALHMPAWIVGIAFTLNTVLLTGLQTFVVRLAEPHRRTRVLVVAGLVWIVSCALLALALVLPQSLLIPYILIVVSIYTFGELLQAPTASALVVEASPEALQGRYVATYQLLAWGVGTSVAPALFTALFTLRPAYPWAVLAGLMLIAILSIFWLEPRLPDQAVRTGAYQAKAATSEAEKST
ncbi:MAG: MFS transporter, partial [Chloroflexi bacterium]|nr:MFS transporter [Chloroflexota bacterium]